MSARLLVVFCVAVMFGLAANAVAAEPINIGEVTWLSDSPAVFVQTATLKNIEVIPNNGPTTISWSWTHPDWPVIFPETGVGGNMWVFAKINGKWFATVWEWLRVNPMTTRVQAEAKPGQPPFIQSKQSPISEWYPKSGEQVGWMVSTVCRPSCTGVVRARSAIVTTRWP